LKTLILLYVKILKYIWKTIKIKFPVADSLPQTTKLLQTMADGRKGEKTICIESYIVSGAFSA